MQAGTLSQESSTVMWTEQDAEARCGDRGGSLDLTNSKTTHREQSFTLGMGRGGLGGSIPGSRDNFHVSPNPHSAPPAGDLGWGSLGSFPFLTLRHQQFWPIPPQERPWHPPISTHPSSCLPAPSNTDCHQDTHHGVLLRPPYIPQMVARGGLYWHELGHVTFLLILQTLLSVLLALVPTRLVSVYPQSPFTIPKSKLGPSAGLPHTPM